MSDTAAGVVTWAHSALTIAPGVALELEPWQRDVLTHAICELEVGVRMFAAPRRTSARRRIQARLVAAQLALVDSPVAIAATSEAGARALLEDARRELEELGATYGIDVRPILDATATEERPM